MIKRNLSRDDFEVGQEIYFVPSNKLGNPFSLKVLKVGRKYVTFTEGANAIQIDISDEAWLVERFFTSKSSSSAAMGKFFFSEAEYKEYLEIKKGIKKAIQLLEKREAIGSLESLDKIIGMIEDEASEN